jgi:2-polyprenyl-3-methyl-5-hydroxy-6-metoxy-1,4-benzoquinol methylase
MTTKEQTDWDSYYMKPAATAYLTRRITARLLVERFRVALHGRSSGLTICELGGANSCFADTLIASLPVTAYHIIDNNAFGLSLLGRKYGSGGVVSWEQADVLRPFGVTRKFDIVYSVGLIEHFDPTSTAFAVHRHFDLVNPNGIVLITFPTPTWLYRATRAAIEAIGRWAFPDERPLEFDEVERAVAPRGRIVWQRINWPILLTQGIVVARPSDADPRR